MSFEITVNTKKYLLHQARRAIYSALQCEFPEKTFQYSPQEVEMQVGAFVTLHKRVANHNLRHLSDAKTERHTTAKKHINSPEKKGELRGCIGRLTGDEALVNTVIKMAKSAAFHDPRFSPVTKEELDNIHLEITVLSPMLPVNPQDVEVGKDGLFTEFMGRHGVLLPQVPVEYGWNRTEFLNHLCLKAGLPADTWENYKISLYKFHGIIFGEDD